MSEVSILIKAVDQATAVLKGVQNSISGLDTTGKRAGSEAGGLAAFSKKAFFIGSTFNMVKGIIGDTVGTINRFTVSAAADMEQTTVAFEVLTGSADLAKQTIEDIQRLGASTPFQFPELADAGRKLLAFGSDAKTVEDELRSIGDIASGIQAPIGEIAEIYGKARVQGRLFAEDINQLTGRGIPIIGEFARMFGTTEQNIKTMVSEGEIGFAELEQAFINMTSEGGQFNGMMEAQSQTFNGLVSTLKDNVTMQLTLIGAKIIETFNLKGALQGGIDFINNNMPLIEGVIDATFNAITNAIGMGKTAVGGFSEEFEIFWDGLQRIWSTGLQPLLVALGPAFSAAFEIAKIALSTLWEVANGVVEGIVLLLEGDLKGAATAFFNVGKDLIQGLLNGIGAMFEGVKQTVTNLGNNVIGWFKSAVQSQSPSKKMIQEGKNLLEGLLEGLQDPALRAEIQAEIDLLGTQLFALNMASSGGLSPVGMTPSRPSIGGSNASPNGVSGGYVPPLAGGLTSPPPLGSPNAMLPSLPVLDVALADMTESVENLTTVVTSLSNAPELASPSVMLPSIPKLNTSLENMGFELNENELSLIGVKEAQRNLTNASIASSDAILKGSTIQKDYNEATKEVALVIPELTLSVKSAVEIFEEEQQKRRDMIEGLTTLSASDGPIGMAGKAFLNLAIEQIPFFASAIQGFVEGGPIGAVVAVFAELFSKSKTLAFLIDAINAVAEPLAATFDIFLPIIRAVGLVFGALYNALSTLVRVVTFGFVDLGQVDLAKLLGIDNIEGGQNTTPDAPTLPEVAAPVTTTSSPSISRPEFDIGRLPTAVQFAVFTPLVETLDKLSIVVERLVDEGIKVQLQSNSSSATQRFRAA